MLTTPSPPPPEGYTDSAYPARAGQPGDTWQRPALPGQQAALDALVWNWGTAYEIGVDDGQWWYRRRDGKGGRETATTPDDLRTMIITEYSIYPVPREHHTIPDQTPSQATPTGPGTP
jgi:hypothetical protein